MKKALHFILAIALAFGLALVLCGSDCDPTNGDGGEEGQVHSLEEARAIAGPIGNAWNPDAYNWFVTGSWVDDEGLLLPGSGSILHFWQFRYNNNGNLDYLVTIYNDGTHIEFEQGLGDDLNLHELPAYTDEDVEFLMNIATNELIGHLGAGDYIYTMTLQATDDDEYPNEALITAYTKYVYGPPLAWVYLNADTGEVLVRSWE